MNKPKEIVEFLKSIKSDFKNNITSYFDIHLVLGNESCDLDSTVSSLVLAYFLHKYRIPKIPQSALVIPVLNVSQQNFLLRTENCFVLQECGIPLDALIYRDEVNIEELLRNKQITTSLVDHHVLSTNDSILQPTVVQILDHRPLDSSSNWSNKDIKLRIEGVGSCSTLIADEIMKLDENFLTKELAYAIYETIIYDTVALRPEVGKAKDLDLLIAAKLEDKFSFNEERDIVHKKLWIAHNDVSHLSPSQILLKDMKIVENVPVPGLPMLTEDFLKLKDAYTAIENLACEYGAPLLILVGIDASNEVKRDAGLFWKNSGEGLKNKLLTALKNSEELKGYNFCFTKVCSGYANIICLRQNNIKLSRKQIIPIIKDVLLENRSLK